MHKDTAKRVIRGYKASKGRFPRGSKRVQSDVPPRGMRKIHRLASRDDVPHTSYDFRFIKRLLSRKVGQPWNQIYSELCSALDRRSIHRYEIKKWLHYFVRQNCSIDDEGQILDKSGFPLGGWCDDFYVHPEKGALEVLRHKKGRRSKVEQRVFELNGQHYCKIKGIWYRVHMEEIDTSCAYTYLDSPLARDVCLQAEIERLGLWSPSRWGTRRLFEQTYGHSPNDRLWYCVFKESANHKEIVQLKHKYDIR